MILRREVSVQRTTRFIQVCGKFDLPTERTSVREWEVDLNLPEDWQIIVIVGPSIRVELGQRVTADGLRLTSYRLNHPVPSTI